MQGTSHKPRKALDLRMSQPTKRKPVSRFKPQSRSAFQHPSGYANRGTFLLVVLYKIEEAFIREFWDKEDDLNEIKTLAYLHYDEGKTTEESATEIKGIRHNKSDKGLGIQDTPEGCDVDQKQHDRNPKRTGFFKEKP